MQHAYRPLQATRKPQRPSERSAILRSFDRHILITTLLIVGIGLILLSSVTSVVAYDQSGDTYAILKQQLSHGVLPGVVLFICFAFLPYRHFQKFGILIYATVLVLLMLSLVPGLGITVNNSRSWIALFGMTMQPSEFAKLPFILWSAWWLSKHISTIGSLRTILSYCLYTAAVCLLLIMQYDLGTMIVYGLVAGSLLVAARAKFRHLFLLCILGIAAISVLILAAPYRLSRVTSFWNPTKDIQGASYQLYQGLVAIGSGHWWGAGLGQSRQKFSYVPEVATDSIFAIIAEELGFIFTVGFLSLFAYLLYRGYRHVKTLTSSFDQFLVLGIILNIAYQLLINVSSVIGLMPLTGIPFPLVSLGGSNMVMLLASLGLLANVTRRTYPHRYD